MSPNFLPIEYSISYFDPEHQDHRTTGIGYFFSFQTKDTLNGANDFLYYLPLSLGSSLIVPFAEDSGGYFFCFNYTKDPVNPTIVLFIGDNPDDTCITPVADIFTDFLSKLNPYRPDISEEVMS